MVVCHKLSLMKMKEVDDIDYSGDLKNGLSLKKAKKNPAVLEKKSQSEILILKKLSTDNVDA